MIQSFNIKFEMSLHEIPENHTLAADLIAETALRHGEWFATIGRLAATCQESLRKYRELLYFDFQ